MRTVSLLLLTALPALVTGCGRRPADAVPRAAADGLHNWTSSPVVVTEEQQSPRLRLLALAPSATEICCALGLREQLVARTRFCDYPPSILGLPEVGDLDELNPETLVGLQPDLVFVSGTSRGITDRLARLNLSFASLPDRSLADVFTAIERVGALTGRPRTAAALCTQLQRDLDNVARTCTSTPPQRVLIVLGPLSDPPSPPFVAGPGSFYDDLLRRAGQLNALVEEGRAYGPLALESILGIDPDVIIELDPEGSARRGGDPEALRAWARLGNLRAVASGRVHVLTGKQHYIPGPRIAQAFSELCRTIAGTGHE